MLKHKVDKHIDRAGWFASLFCDETHLPRIKAIVKRNFAKSWILQKHIIQQLVYGDNNIAGIAAQIHLRNQVCTAMDDVGAKPCLFTVGDKRIAIFAAIADNALPL